MQSTGALVIVAALAVVALTSSVDCADGIRNELLPLSSEMSQLRDEIVQMLRQGTMPASLEPHEMLEEFTRLRETAPSLYERSFYSEMHKLGEDGIGACNTLTMRYIYEIVSLSAEHNDLPALTNYINFLKSYGKAKFAECAATTEDLFKEKMSGGLRGMKQPEVFQNIENGLDRFFMAYVGSKRVLSDSNLYEVAKEANLARDEFKINRMLKVATEFKIRSSESGPVDLVIEFLIDSCAGLQRPLNVLFGNYNIADALGAQLPTRLPIRFLKLNAYNRICVALRKGEAEARANIMRQLKDGDSDSSNSSNSNNNSNGKWFKFY